MATTKRKTSVKKSSPKRLAVTKSAAKKTVKKSSRAIKSLESMEKQMTPSNQTPYLKNPRLWVGVAVVVVAIAVYVYKGLFIAAVVNGQPITRLAVVNQLEKQSGKQALDNLIVQSLVFQEAQKKNITVSQSDVDGEIKKIEDQLKGQNVTLQDALAARGLTQKDLTDQIKLQKLLNKMIGTSVKVTNDDVQAYIDKNQDSLPKDMSDDDLKKQVRTQLEQQQLQDKTQTFVTDLQKKAKITYFVSY